MSQTVQCPFCNKTQTINPARVILSNHSYDVYKCPKCGTTLASIDIEQDEVNKTIGKIERQIKLMGIDSTESQH